jgi:hypothetical protein
MIKLLKKIIICIILLSLGVNAETNKDSIALVSVIKPKLEGFSTSGIGSLIGAATIPYVGEIIGGETEARVSEEKYSKDFNGYIQSKEVTDTIVNQIKLALVSSNKFNVLDTTYIEENEIKYEDWVEKKERLSKNTEDYICEIGINRVRLEDQYFIKILRAEFAIKIINKDGAIKTQATNLGDFFFRWEYVEGIKDKNDSSEVKKAYLETLNKLSKKLAKELVDKI